MVKRYAQELNGIECQQADIMKGADMKERANAVTLGGNPVTLLGDEPQPGSKAPDAELVSNDLKPVRLSDFKGKVRIISTVLSLETSVCDLMTRRFNQEAADLDDDVAIITISMDLPFTQKKWCGAQGVDRITTLSDHRNASFGTAYGVLIKELRLLARSVTVIDRDDKIRYCQIVKEIGEEPDYDAALNAVRELV